jgi:tetratricopeptide (TPR) repeat protein
VPWLYGHAGEAAEKLVAALDHTKSSGSRGDEMAALAFLTKVLMWGPTPVTDALGRYDSISDRAEADLRVRASVACGRSVFLAMLGNHAAARGDLERSIQIFRDLGLPIEAAEVAQSGSLVLSFAGDNAGAADMLAKASEELAALKEMFMRPTHRGMLARCLVALGKVDDAEREALACRDTGQSGDVVIEFLWRAALAMVLARRGDSAQADVLSLEAVSLAEGCDFWPTAWAWSDRADVLARADRQDEAEAAMARAIEIYGRKGATAVVEQLKAGQEARAEGTGRV